MYRKDLRPEIVDSFIAEFNEFGPKLTLDRVSSRIHISKKTIYRFFRSKDEIYSYILKQAARDVAMGQQAVLEDSSLSPAEKVRRILTVETLWESKIDISKVAELTEEAPGIAKEILEAYHASWDAVRLALNEAKEKGVVRPEVNVDLVLTYLEASMKSLYSSKVLKEQHLSYTQAISALASLVVDGILASATQSKPGTRPVFSCPKEKPADRSAGKRTQLNGNRSGPSRSRREGPRFSRHGVPRG